jgi:hypothetical protein
MVGYAFAAQLPDRVTRWVAMDASLPDIGNWEKIIQSPHLWHFNFRGPDVEGLVKDRERIYLDRFWDELSANPQAIDEATREHYAVRSHCQRIRGISALWAMCGQRVIAVG